MKKNILISLLLFVLMPGLVIAQKKRFIEGEIYVRFKSNTSVSKKPNHAKEDVLPFVRLLKDLKETYGLKNLRNSFHFSRFDKFKRTYRLQFDKKEKREELLAALRSHPEIEFADPIPYAELHWVPDDIGDDTNNGQYALHLMNAEKAWDITRGRRSVVVAVVDNGIDLDHVDLINKLVAGYDLADGDGNPDIPHTGFTHGTHVAGIVGAETNNNQGVASIGNLVMIMPVKVTYDDAENFKEVSHGYEGILWAAEHGADIINCSWGAYETLASNEDVIATATALGSLVVASAGNDNTTRKEYPAAFPGVLAVGSSDINELKSSFSNSGDWVDVCAPGTNILSTIPTTFTQFGEYDYFNGTSMAAPMVSAVCALVKSVSSSYTPAEITQIIKNTANTLIYANDPSMNGALGAGRVDAYFAVREAYKCVSDKTISNDILRTPFTECSNWIKTDGSCTVPTNEQVIFDAGSYIELKPGFRATYGSVFRAHIDGCGGNELLK